MDTTQITNEQAEQFARDARQEMQDGKRQFNDFLFDMGKRVQDGKTLSDGQMHGLKKFVVREQEFEARKAQQAAADANAEDCPEGTNRLRGEVVSVKYKESMYGTQLKMVLKDERGFRVWMTVPGRIADMVDNPLDDLRGATIEVTATITPSDDDRVFGFGKQPRDAKLVALATPAQPTSPAPVVEPPSPSVQPVLPKKQSVDTSAYKAQREADLASEKAHDAARTAAGTPTAVNPDVLATLSDEDEVKVSVNGADPITMPWKTGRVVVETTVNGQPVGVVVGLGAQQSIPF